MTTSSASAGALDGLHSCPYHDRVPSRRPLLFDPIPRNDHRLPRRSESEWAYLNLSARPEAALVRATYREWFDRYPSTDAGEFARKFRSPRSRYLTAPAFELALHEALRRMQLDVAVPRKIRGKNHFDFDVAFDGDCTAVEARVVAGEDSETAQRKRDQDRALDALDEIPHPRFAVHLWECRVDGVDGDLLQRLRAGIVAKLDTLSGPEVADWAAAVAAQDYDRLPKWIYEDQTTSLRWSPVPKPLPSVVIGERYTGGLLFNLQHIKAMQRVTIGDEMVPAIKEKADKDYPLDGRPLVLALGSTHWAGADDFEVFRALYGTERWRLVTNGEGEAALGDSFRDSDGVWGPHSRHNVTNLSAVLVFRRFRVWHPWTTTWRVYLNPWAETASPPWLQNLPRWLPGDNGVLQFHDGVALDQVLGPAFDL